MSLYICCLELKPQLYLKLFSVLMGNIRFSFWENHLGLAVSSLYSQAEGMTTGCNSQGLGRVLQSCFSTGHDGYFSVIDYSSY